MVVAFVISLIILTSCEQRQSKDYHLFEQRQSKDYRLAEEFKSLGLKGDLKVIDTTKEIEGYYGTRVKLNYTEKFSDGYVLNENTQADIREPSGEHGADLYFDLSSKIEPLLNVKEKELFDIAKRNEFNFLLNVYKKRPGYKLEEDKIKKDIAKRINELFNGEVMSENSCKFEARLRDEVCAAVISQAVKNRNNGDFEAAGFYNITPENLMKRKGVDVILFFDFNRLKTDASFPYLPEQIDNVKAKLLSLPKGSFLDGVYLIKGNYYDVRKRTDFELICTFVVEDGIGHFEEDKIISEKKI